MSQIYSFLFICLRAFQFIFGKMYLFVADFYRKTHLFDGKIYRKTHLFVDKRLFLQLKNK